MAYEYMTETITVAQAISEALGAYRRCAESGNTEWESRWGERLSRIDASLPSGSGLDIGSVIVRDWSPADGDADTAFMIGASYHAMDSSGMYAGWYPFNVIVSASFSGPIVSVEWASGKTPEEEYDETLEPLGEPNPCLVCGGSGVVEPDADGYDGCPECNYGDGPTGVAPEPPEPEEWYGVSDPTDWIIDVYTEAVSRETTRAEWEPETASVGVA